jgi:hypothetical protein
LESTIVQRHSELDRVAGYSPYVVAPPRGATALLKEQSKQIDIYRHMNGSFTAVEDLRRLQKEYDELEFVASGLYSAPLSI